MKRILKLYQCPNIIDNNTLTVRVLIIHYDHKRDKNDGIFQKIPIIYLYQVSHHQQKTQILHATTDKLLDNFMRTVHCLLYLSLLA